jgi:hypothetical protein
MPYRLDPADRRCVQVQRPAGWRRLQCHPTTGAARAHLTALTVNVEKRMDMEGVFSKLDEDRQLAFGWASVATVGDEPALVDKQGDVLDVPSLEEAVYDYVLESRDADEMHQRAGVGQLVESMMFTAEKIEKMGLDPAVVPIGWWVGFRVTDPEVWGRVKDGTYRQFSIRGRGAREEMS